MVSIYIYIFISDTDYLGIDTGVMQRNILAPYRFILF